MKSAETLTHWTAGKALGPRRACGPGAGGPRMGRRGGFSFCPEGAAPSGRAESGVSLEPEQVSQTWLLSRLHPPTTLSSLDSDF